MKLIYLLPTFILSILTISSCGKDGSDGSDVTVVGTPTSTPEGCLTNQEKLDIQTYLNRISNIPEILGSGTRSVRIADGTFQNIDIAAAYDLIPESDYTWLVRELICEAAGCYPLNEFRYSILADNCLYEDSIKTNVSSSSTSKLNYSVTDVDGIASNVATSLSAEKLSIKNTASQGGVVFLIYNFLQE